MSGKMYVRPEIRKLVDAWARDKGLAQKAVQDLEERIENFVARLEEEGDLELQHKNQELQEEIQELDDEIRDLRDEIEKLEEDVEYWQGRSSDLAESGW